MDMWTAEEQDISVRLLPMSERMKGKKFYEIWKLLMKFRPDIVLVLMYLYAYGPQIEFCKPWKVPEIMTTIDYCLTNNCTVF